MRNLLTPFLLVIFLSSCARSRTVIKQNTFEKGKIETTTIASPEEKKKLDITIAILPFANNSPDKSLDSTGITLADLISAQMSSKKGFKLVERQRIEKLLNEMNFGQAGMINQTTAVQIGKILGANVMAFGSFTTLGKKTLLTMRLVKVETSEIVGGVTERGDDVSNLDILAEDAARKLSDSLTTK